MWSGGIRWVRSVAMACIVVGIAAELILAVALAVVVSRPVHDPAAHQQQELVVERLIMAMFAVAVCMPVALVLGLAFTGAATKDRLGTRVLTAQIDHIFSNAADTDVENTCSVDVDLVRAETTMGALGGHTWCGRPQRDPALCHHAWRVNQWGHLTTGIFWFAGNGFDGLGSFDVRGCANPCVPDGTTLLAWTQTYLDREDVQRPERFSYEFRGTLTVESTDTPTICGTWDRHMADSLDARPGDILHGEFVLMPASSDQRRKGETAPVHDDSKGNCLDAHRPPAEPTCSQPHVDG
ncbi:hypothetical protein pqer_cds_32 [Pandoravirus quercus]|uniref:Uncharacterized protein n=2 Tax=Pandoravirus TaxID=2060084 RepID=A0A2U7U7Q5_9VIRU|nr:hypothetical protein pqer_cds_32 [Pandoravirus quercus]AVK74454.1 hypothetical protein pqer_cds_32 [Pandoravirus quercus]QBZ80624.1 hypothetical protein pclt_cds_24 [Pandoravirus celtis]